MGPDNLMSAAAVQDLAPAHSTARIAGVVNGFGSLGQVVSPYAVAWTVRFTGWDALFGAFIVVALVGALAGMTQWKITPPSVQQLALAEAGTP